MSRPSKVPDMYMDVLASRLGMANATDAALKTELGRYSLKTQGLLGHRCPTPMLAGYWDNDLLCPKEEASLIVNSSTNGKLLPIKAAPIYRNFHQVLGHISDWLKGALNA